jgi:glycosyltransferase involved in cell wall biosynthesis
MNSNSKNCVFGNITQNVVTTQSEAQTGLIDVIDPRDEAAPFPLVSIVVITYNSSKYVIETFESAKAQTYKNIELIVSDDASTDNTVDICRKWIDENKKRFARTELIVAKRNTGIPSNCNRGVKAAKGEWVKLIAGDDINMKDAIGQNISFVRGAEEPLAFVFSGIKRIDENGQDYHAKTPNNNTSNAFFRKNANEQYKDLIKGNKNIFIPAASSFLLKGALLSLGGFDEEILYCEDYPMWIKATKAGFKLHYFNEITACYRVHSDSIMTNQSMRYHTSMRRVFFKYRFIPLLFCNPFLAIEYLIWNLSRTIPGLNRAVKYILPHTYYNYFKNKL